MLILLISSRFLLKNLPQGTKRDHNGESKSVETSATENSNNVMESDDPTNTCEDCTDENETNTERYQKTIVVIVSNVLFSVAKKTKTDNNNNNNKGKMSKRQQRKQYQKEKNARQQVQTPLTSYYCTDSNYVDVYFCLLLLSVFFIFIIIIVF